MKRSSLILLGFVAACQFYADDPVLTDNPDSGPDATMTGIDARVEDGEFLACGEPTVCPAPTGGRVTMCGQILDLETAEPIEAAETLELRFYDILSFASDPDAPPLDVGTVELFDCGAFRAVDIPIPFNRFIGVVVDDAGSADEVVPAVTARTIASASVLTDVRAVTARRTTDAQWTDIAGDPFGGDSFTDVGAYLGVFLRDGIPTSGVTVQAGGAPRPDDDFYFSDLDAQRREVDPSRSSTGPNGSVLLVDVSLGQIAGEGVLPPECEWTSTLSASIPGAIWYGEHREDCPTE